MQEENRILRQQLGRTRPRFNDIQRRHLAAIAKLIEQQGRHEINTVVTPDILPRWYRTLITEKYDGGSRQTLGRHKIAAESQQIILRVARSNPSWNYARSCGALSNAGPDIGRKTIKRILLNNRIDPTTRRDKGLSWETFLKAHWGAIAATDLFSIEVLTRRGLVQHIVLFFIDLKTRQVKIAGIVQKPDGEWMQQIARNVFDVDDGFLNGCCYRIHDRDPLFTEAFRALLASSDVTCLKLPARSPNLNA